MSVHQIERREVTLSYSKYIEQNATISFIVKLFKVGVKLLVRSVIRDTKFNKT